MPLVTDKSSALLLIEEALEEKSMITDLDDVELYDHAFQNILPEPQQRWASTIGELRWQFVKSSPKEENASIDCFKACLLKGDLEHAIKVVHQFPSFLTQILPSSGFKKAQITDIIWNTTRLQQVLM
jgi:N-terminal acetyltransferase B complex non-catalytic subunit